LVEFDITAGAQRTQSSNVRLSGTVDEVKDQYYYDDFDNASLVDQSNSNLGYYAETVLGYRENLYLTLGGRVEENEYFGKDYGTHFSPQMGISLISELGSVIAKLRGSWGGGGISPPQSMQALPSESSTSINIGNPDLKPERQSGYEVGGDFYFGDNFFLEVTYFDQLFRDGIQNDPSIDDPETVKREYWYINFGEIINKGWEFALKTRFGPLGINATYSILDSRWGQDSIRQNDLQYEGFFDEGVRRNDVPTSTANLSLTYNIPPIISKNKKGGSLVLDFNYIGDKKGRDWLLQYDGFYNPNVDYISYYSKDLLVNYKPYVTVRLRWNYWFTRNINIYFDVRNLTEHEDISSGITQPALGRQMVLGFDLEF
jgi:outer membrane receptor protein involved in Fe transport